MHGRGLSSNVRRATYASIVHEPSVPRSALANASRKHRPALTFHDYLERDRKKACLVFRGVGDVCERRGCAHPRSKHPAIWRQA